MYRRLSPRQLESRARKLEAMRRGAEAARLARPAKGRPPELPELRREVTVTDHDTGTPVTHHFALHRTNRVDTYLVHVDGLVWKRAGWTECLTGLRKAYPRVPSPRSDFWW